MTRKWTIIRLENNKFFYFKEKIEDKLVWTTNAKRARLFDSTGGAELFAVQNNIKSLGIKRIEV